MDIQAPEPETEDVVDYEFVYAGDTSSALTIVPTKGHRVASTTDGPWLLFTIGSETITVFTRNLLYMTRRERTRKLPPKVLPGPNGAPKPPVTP